MWDVNVDGRKHDELDFFVLITCLSVEAEL